VLVTGRLDQRSWQSEAGERRSKVEVNAEDLPPPCVWPRPSWPVPSAMAPRSAQDRRRQAVTALTKSPTNFSVPDGVGPIGPRATRSRERQRDLHSAELAADLATKAAELRLTCPDRRSKGARWVSSHATLVSGLSQEKKTRSSPLLRMG
jgi:hypothetical protein